MSFFKFNNYSGRISATSQASAYTPQGLQLAVATERIPFQFESSLVKTAQNVSHSVDIPLGGAVKGAAKGLVPKESGYGSIMNLQKKMVLEDGHMVWQKRGAADKLPFFLTMGLVTITTLYGLSLIVKMSFPPKKK